MIHILLVEDNPRDVRLTREALTGGEVVNSLSVAQDGVEALAYLYRQGKYSDAIEPDLILLDLSLPQKDGLEVLAQIKQDPQLWCIPVVILTACQAEQTITKAYDLQANGYVTKPVGLDQFIDIVRSVGDFWASVVKLPTEGRSCAQRRATCRKEQRMPDMGLQQSRLVHHSPGVQAISFVGRGGSGRDGR